MKKFPDGKKLPACPEYSVPCYSQCLHKCITIVAASISTNWSCKTDLHSATAQHLGLLRVKIPEVSFSSPFYCTAISSTEKLRGRGSRSFSSRDKLPVFGRQLSLALLLDFLCLVLSCHFSSVAGEIIPLLWGEIIPMGLTHRWQECMLYGHRVLGVCWMMLKPPCNKDTAHYRLLLKNNCRRNVEK